MPAKLIDAGLDYLRITSDDRAAQVHLGEYFREVAKRDRELGYETTKGGAFGFFGKKTRHALLASKKEWDMLQVTGYESKGGWSLAHEGTQASRVDLQLTYQVGEDAVGSTIRAAYDGACALEDSQRRHLKVTMIESRHKAQTVYIGSRASDIFLRVYDKYAESGREEYRGCVRFELELKGRASKAYWEQVVLQKMTIAQSLEMVVTMFRERGAPVPNEDIQDMDIHLPPRQPTRTQTTLDWLNRQVAPTVKRLTKEYDWMYCFSVLFGDALPSRRRAHVARVLAKDWGS